MGAEDAWEVGARRRRRWPVLLLAALAAPALVVLERGGVTPGDGAGIPLEPPTGEASPPPEAAGGADPSPAVARGAWEPLGEAPVPAPVEHQAVWTGGELVVFGHAGSAASFRVEARRWIALPGAPVRLTGVPAPLWTGSEVLVWGAPSEGAAGRLAVAAYDPGSVTWRAGATSPLPTLTSGVAVWTGREALVWGALASGSKVAASYDPAADAWTRLPQAPVPPADGMGGLWTGRELVVWGERVGFGGTPFAAAYDPAARRWRRLPGPPLQQPSTAAAAWTGRELLLWGTPRREGGGADPAGAALRTEGAGAQWRELDAAPPGSARGYGQVSASAAWTGEQVAVVGTLTGAGGWLHHPVTGTWEVLPGGGGRRLSPALAWTGEELLVWGGYTSGGPVVDLVAWRPERRAGALGRTHVLAWYCHQSALLDVRERTCEALTVPEPARPLPPGNRDALHAVARDGEVLTYRP